LETVNDRTGDGRNVVEVAALVVVSGGEEVAVGFGDGAAELVLPLPTSLAASPPGDVGTAASAMGFEDAHGLGDRTKKRRGATTRTLEGYVLESY
jgi:hypothetical protein